MVMLDIGAKVATLPVIALGVGIDYSLYLLSAQLALTRAGVPLASAYQQALSFTGTVMALIGITLAAGIVTWAWSQIMFQADMGILLTLLFVVHMLGTLILVPALSYFLFAGDRYVGMGKRKVVGHAVPADDVSVSHNVGETRLSEGRSVKSSRKFYEAAKQGVHHHWRR